MSLQTKIMSDMEEIAVAKNTLQAAQREFAKVHIPIQKNHNIILEKVLEEANKEHEGEHGWAMMKWYTSAKFTENGVELLADSFLPANVSTTLWNWRRVEAVLSLRYQWGLN